MPPFLALFLCAVFVFWLFKVDVQARGKLAPALLIPLIWLAIRGSRPLTYWISGTTGGGSELEGNAIDRVFFTFLFVLAFLVLQQRRFPLGRYAALNPTLSLLFLYLAISVLWAPYPFVAFKRWIKEVGAILIMLIIVSEPDPLRAFRAIFARCAYLFFPLSIVLFHYFPALGREFSKGGAMTITGVTIQKNTLGQICCVFGLALLSELIDDKSAPRQGSAFRFKLARWMVFGIGMWLLVASQSATSLVATIIGAIVLLAPKLPVVARHSRGFATLVSVTVITGLFAAVLSNSVLRPVVEALGRDTTLTGRSRIWELVLEQDINPWIGTGFYSFWLEKGQEVWSHFRGSNVNTAHSGYIETYLDSGYIGCALLFLFLFTTGVRLQRRYIASDSMGRLMFCYFIVALVMNYSESYFFRLGPLWFCVLLGSFLVRQYALRTVEIPAQELRSGPSPVPQV